MFSRSFFFAAAAVTLSSAVVAQDAAGTSETVLTEFTNKVTRNDASPELIFKRQDGTCYAFGIDYQDGGSYFIGEVISIRE